MNSDNGIINAATLKRPGERSASRAASDDSPPPYLLPRFKPEWLPQPFRHFATSLAANLGVPLEMVALQALALPSVLAGHAIDVEPREGWVEPATIYAVTIANTGAGKSPAMKRFTGFIMRAEKDRRETARQHHQERIRELEAVVTAQGEDAAEAKDEVARLRKAGPPSPRLHVTDATDERLATLMEANNGPVAVWAAEPKFFRVAAGAYSKTGPATDVMLQGYSGDPIRVERQTAKSVCVDRPRITIAMMTQRKPVEDFLDATGHDERGELSRFLMCSPPDWRGYSKLGPPVPGLHFKYAEERARWLGVLGAQEKPQTVRPTPEALSRFEEWHEEHERLQRPGGPRREPAGWVSKMRGLVWRLAGIIHMAETVAPSGAVAPEISLEVLERAIAIAEWGLEQARAIYRVTQENVVSRQLDRLRDVLGEKPGMRRSELWGRLKGSQGITRAAHLTGLLDELETCGELRREETSPGPRGGRPGQRLWLVQVGSGEETGT